MTRSMQSVPKARTASLHPCTNGTRDGTLKIEGLLQPWFQPWYRTAQYGRGSGIGRPPRAQPPYCVLSSVQPPIMGNCMHRAAQERPTCSKCGKVGTLPLRLMKPRERRSWVLTGSQMVCGTCIRAEVAERQRLQKTLFKMQMVKERLYPKAQPKKELKKIRSGVAWEGTASFRESWRPGSFVATLLRISGMGASQQPPGSRVSAAAGAAGTPGGADADVAQQAERSHRQGDAAAAAATASQQPLGQHWGLGEGLAAVQEEALHEGGSSSASGGSADGSSIEADETGLGAAGAQGAGTGCGGSGSQNSGRGGVGGGGGAERGQQGGPSSITAGQQPGSGACKALGKLPSHRQSLKTVSSRRLEVK